MKIKNQNAETITESLGISDERHRELVEHIKAIASGPSDTVTEDLARLADKAENLEEVVFMTLQFGRFLEHRDSTISRLAKMLDSFSGMN